MRFLKYCLIALMLSLCLASCSVSNRPPDPGTPWPAAHDGVFASGADILRFNGDGKSISWQFAAPASTLPAQGAGTYAFLFHNENWRYDAAEKIRITPADNPNTSTVFTLSNPATATTITLLLDGRQAVFTKQ